MSRLIDKLKLVTRSAPQPLGFQAVKSAPSRPPMLLIISPLQLRSVTRLTNSVTGADAILLHPGKTAPGTNTLSQLSQSLPDIPWGGWLEDGGKEEASQLIAAGSDFLVFPASSTLGITSQNDQVGKVLVVEPSLSDGLLRAVNDLPVDAVLAAQSGQGTALTWHHLMLFQRLANIVNKPLLAPVPAGITANDIQPLWEVGVNGIVVTGATEQLRSQLPELRRAIDDLKQLPRKRGRVEAVLPRISGEVGAVEEGEEEEEV